MEAGAVANFSYESTRSVRWDVHTHDPVTKQVTTPESGKGPSHAIAFTAPSRGMYSFSVIADEGEATVKYAVEGVMRVHSYSQA